MLDVLLDQSDNLDLNFTYYANRSLFAIIDEDFELADEWTGGRQRVRPILSDQLL